MSYIIMIIAAIFVNNIVLAQFLGICPFLGVSKKVDTAAGMGMAVWLAVHADHRLYPCDCGSRTDG